MDEIRVELKVTFLGILTAKLFRWSRRNFWLYLLVSAVLSFALASRTEDGPLDVATWLVPSVLGLSVSAMLISAAVQSRTRQDLACALLFREEKVRITDSEGERAIEWDWLAPARESRTYFVLRRGRDPKNLIFVRKGGSSLPTDEHVETLRRWLRKSAGL